GEMLDLAVHIIKTKQGAFDPRKFEDRYEDALAELVKLKLEGKAIPRRAQQQRQSQPRRGARQADEWRSKPTGKSAISPRPPSPRARRRSPTATFSSCRNTTRRGSIMIFASRSTGS